MIVAIALTSVWLFVGAVVFAVLFTRDDWCWALGLSAVWPVVAAIGLFVSISGTFAEARALWKGDP